MKLPRLAKLGRSVPMRCAMKAAWLLASFFDEHSWPMKSRARISPTKSKKNRFMIAQPSQNRSVPKVPVQRKRPKGLRPPSATPSHRFGAAADGSLPVDDFSRVVLCKGPPSSKHDYPLFSKSSLCSTARIARLESRSRFLTSERHATSIACAATSRASWNFTA
jgi:hypothetical protein